MVEAKPENIIAAEVTDEVKAAVNEVEVQDYKHFDMDKDEREIE